MSYEITNMGQASSASRKLKEAYKAKEDLKQWYETELENLRLAYEEEQKPHDSTIDYFQHLLGVYLRKEIAAGRQKKSISLPGGTFRMTARQPKIHIEKENEFLKWAQENLPEVVRTKTSVNQAELRKTVHLENGGRAFTPDGELIEGILWDEQEDSISFTPSSDGGHDE